MSFFVGALGTGQDEPSTPLRPVRYRPASVIGLVHAGIPTFPGISPTNRSDLSTPLSCAFPFLPSTKNAWDSPTLRDEASDLESNSSLDYNTEKSDSEELEATEQTNITLSEDMMPLPSSTSFVLNLRPKTFREWKDALAKVKALFFDNQFKECIARCEALLANPVEQVILSVGCLLTFGSP